MSIFSFIKNSKKTPHQPLSKHELRERRDYRLQHHKLLWGILRHYIILDSLRNVSHLYEVKKLLAEWEMLQNILCDVRDVQVNEYDFTIVRRFIRREQFLGHCTQEEIPDITFQNYLETDKINTRDVLLTMYDNYETYWESVIVSCTKAYYRKRRLQVLIGDLDRDLNDPLTTDVKVRLKITILRDKYADLLNHLI